MMQDKYKSRKFIAASWAAIMITSLSILSISTKYSPDWLNSLLPLLSTIIMVYVGGEALIDSSSKKIIKK